MYGYIHGISSSRRLQAEAERNIEVIWLLSTLAPSYRVIADYRKDYPARLARVNAAVVRFLIDGGWIDGERVAVDGTKLKAYTGWDMPDEEALEKRLQKAHSSLEDWLQLSDPEARPMRAPLGGKPPAYNLQAVVDSAHKMIITASVTNEATDFEQLLPMPTATSRRLGTAPKELLADTGYADLGDIKHIQTETRTRCYIPENDAPVANRNVQFTYEPEVDQYRCSAGRTLAPIAKGRYRKDKDAYIDIYRGTDCAGCPMADDCTSAADGMRQVSVFHGAPWRHEYARQIGSRYCKARIAERKSIVEGVFGTLKYWMGQIPLKLRGLRKVQTEIDLYAAGYNLKRWFSLGSFKELMGEIANWSGSAAAQPT
jgi:hypothetical protein